MGIEFYSKVLNLARRFDKLIKFHQSFLCNALKLQFVDIKPIIFFREIERLLQVTVYRPILYHGSIPIHRSHYLLHQNLLHELLLLGYLSLFL